MVSRGVPQLKNIRLYFCDFGGSSQGVRQALGSQEFASFVDANPHLNVEIYMRRNFHPVMSSTYVNGYVKDQSLKKFDSGDVVGWLTKVNSEFGRRALQHNANKVVTERKSIQGAWSENVWNQFPKHLIQAKRDIPSRIIEELPPRPKMDKKVRPHRQTAIARKKYVLPPTE